MNFGRGDYAFPISLKLDAEGPKFSTILCFSNSNQLNIHDSSVGPCCRIAYIVRRVCVTIIDGHVIKVLETLIDSQKAFIPKPQYLLLIRNFVYIMKGNKRNVVNGHIFKDLEILGFYSLKKVGSSIMRVRNGSVQTHQNKHFPSPQNRYFELIMDSYAYILNHFNNQPSAQSNFQLHELFKRSTIKIHFPFKTQKSYINSRTVARG